MLEARGIPHRVVSFDPAIRSAQAVAAATGIAAEAVYKTLVVEEEPPRGKPLLVMVPADDEIDLKALAAALGLKRLRMASHQQAERQTGLKVGGISALALIGKGFRVFIDARAAALPEVTVSAGQRGFDVALTVDDLVALTGARFVATGPAEAGA